MKRQKSRSKKNLKFKNVITTILSIFGIIAIAIGIGYRTSFESSASTITGNTYYVSPTGSDNNPGTSSQPFKTLVFAVSKLIPGDGLILKDGTYNESLKINKFGTENLPITIKAENLHKAIISQSTSTSSVVIQSDYIVLDGIEVSQSGHYCIENLGKNVTIQNTKVHHCQDHGIYTENINTTIANNEVYLSNLMNIARTRSSGWGSAIKVKLGGNNSIITKNNVHNNYGEGIAVTRGDTALISQNTTYDNFGVNIYVDNSKNVRVDSNLSYCTGNAEFYRDGNPASAYGMEEEPYDGWGAQLENVTFTNNLGYGCYRGIYYWRSTVDGIGLQNVTIANNTFVNMTKGSVYIETTNTDTNNSIVNNIFFQSNNTYGYLERLQGFTVSNNLFNTQPSSWTYLGGTNSIYTNPQFAISPSANNPNSFKLASSSPAINRGLAGFTPSDFFQNMRESSVDLGAHEFVGQTTTATPIPTATPIQSPVSTPISNPTPTPTLTTSNSEPYFLTTRLSRLYSNTTFSIPISAADSNSPEVLTMTAQNLPEGTALTSCTPRYNTGKSRTEIKCLLTGSIRNKGTYYPIFKVQDSQNSQKSIQLKLTVR